MSTKCEKAIIRRGVVSTAPRQSEKRRNLNRPGREYCVMTASFQDGNGAGT
ncbi:MAG: hypothetical protein WB502_00010 [Thermoactinomyces sp.]